MGCGASSANERQVQNKPHEQKIAKSRVVYTGEESLRSAFGYLLSKATKLYCGSGLVPSVCLSKESFSVINHTVKLSDDLSIQLPILTGSFRKMGRVLCFPHVGMLDSTLIDRDSTRQIVSNGMYWLAGEKTTMTPVLLLGFPDELVMRAKLTLHNLGFFVESSPRMPRLNNFKVVLVPSSLECDSECGQALTAFVEEGGGLGVLFTPVNLDNVLMFPMNNMLHVFGLSYTYCSISNTDASLAINRDYEEAQKSHFTALVENLKTVLQDPNVSSDALDNIVTTLRYYVTVCGEAEKSMIAQVYDLCWDFLVASDAVEGENFGRDENHGIIMVLMQELTPNVPADRIRPAIGHHVFPGKCENVESASFTLSLEVVQESWISTGLYLPPGSVGYVVCDEPLPNVCVQIGAHHELLLSKPHPWKRWPAVVSTFNLTGTNNPIASSFGGIVYLTATDTPLPQLVKLKFENFSMYPRCIDGIESMWDSTKSLGIPWGELQGSHIVVTLPKGAMETLDCPRVCHVLNELASTITDFMAYAFVHPFRIIFDVDLIDNEPVCGYPIVFNVDDISAILGDLTEPNESLLKLTNMIALLTIRDGCFDPAVELSLSTVASFVAFEKVFGSFNPGQFAVPTLAEGLWEVYNNSPVNVIPDTMRIFQDPSHGLTDVPEDTWIEFVREMCRIGKTNYTRLLERAKPIPLNVSKSCGEFEILKDDDVGLSLIAQG